MDELDDSTIRLMAFEHVRLAMERKGFLDQSDSRLLLPDGTNIVLWQQSGMCKPRRMNQLLSVRSSQKAKYALSFSEQGVEYDFYQPKNVTPANHHQLSPNQLSLAAMKSNTPIIYFVQINQSPSRYLGFAPVYIVDWDLNSRKIILKLPGQMYDYRMNQEEIDADDETEKKYRLRIVRQRVHQPWFRHKLLEAYGERCAFSGFPETSLLDAAHIIPDASEAGEPKVQNGLLLTKIHHAAFDQNLIGIDPDYTLHLAEKLKNINDGPQLETFKSLEGQKLRLPKQKKNHPDRERLEQRFIEFRKAA